MEIKEIGSRLAAVLQLEEAEDSAAVELALELAYLKGRQDQAESGGFDFDEIIAKLAPAAAQAVRMINEATAGPGPVQVGAPLPTLDDFAKTAVSVPEAKLAELGYFDDDAGRPVPFGDPEWSPRKAAEAIVQRTGNDESGDPEVN